MKTSKLMKIYDNSYDETISLILRRHSNREKAKRIMGEIYQETLRKLTRRHTDVESVRRLFEKTKMRFGVV